MTAWVEVAGPDQLVSRHPVNAILSVGRGKNNTIVIRDSSASRNHAVIMDNGDSEYHLSDLGSRNGTLLNGQPVKGSIAIKGGDIIQIGRVSMRFQMINTKPTGGDDDEEEPDMPTMVNFTSTEVVVLVVDIINYSTMSEQMPPNAVSVLAAKWFKALGDMVGGLGGTVNKIIGDAAMIIWSGNKEQLPTNAIMGVRGALQSLHLAYTFHQELEEENRPETFGVRCGVHCGTASMGNVGSAGISDFTVMGDSVNVAFRLQTMARPLGRHVLISREVYDFVSPYYTFESMGLQDVKGRENQVEIFCVTGYNMEAWTQNQ